MIRQACESDLDRIEAIYEAIHTEEEAGHLSTGWTRGIYPLRKDAEASLAGQELFVCEREGLVVASARLNREQLPSYGETDWLYPASDQEVMVIHTLAVDPACSGSGIGTEFVHFYEMYAKDCGCKVLRMDTNVTNLAARSLYHKLGYREASVIPCEFNGIPGVSLVCLEKKL